MSGDVLKVNPDVLRDVGAAFCAAADQLTGLQAEVPLGDAASAVPQLLTASACAKAQADVAAEMAVLVDNARKYSDNLANAARLYQAQDEASAEAISNIKFPQVSVRP